MSVFTSIDKLDEEYEEFHEKTKSIENDEDNEIRVKSPHFENVGELIDFLEPHRKRSLIIDDDNTDGGLRNHFYLWDENLRKLLIFTVFLDRPSSRILTSRKKS